VAREDTALFRYRKSCVAVDQKGKPGHLALSCRKACMGGRGRRICCEPFMARHETRRHNCSSLSLVPFLRSSLPWSSSVRAACYCPPPSLHHESQSLRSIAREQDPSRSRPVQPGSDPCPAHGVITLGGSHVMLLHHPIPKRGILLASREQGRESFWFPITARIRYLDLYTTLCACPVAGLSFS
jgi:hypothetical protein